MAEQLPYIYKKVREITPSGHTLKETQLTVQGENLKEVEKIFDKKWKPKN